MKYVIGGLIVWGVMLVASATVEVPKYAGLRREARTQADNRAKGAGLITAGILFYLNRKKRD